MKFTFTSSFDEDFFEYKNQVFHVDLSFDNILLLFEMFDDEEIYEHEKVYFALQMLIDEYEEMEIDSFDEALELFKFVMYEFLDIDFDQNGEGTNVKVYDFQKDADLIFASFFAVYNLDLFELKGKLHWKKFQALLTHIDEKSSFKQVVGYRVMKVPSEKEASKDYIQHVRNMKRLYSLEDGPQDVSNVFDSLASTFKTRKKEVIDNG